MNARGWRFTAFKSDLYTEQRAVYTDTGGANPTTTAKVSAPTGHTKMSCPRRAPKLYPPTFASEWGPWHLEGQFVGGALATGEAGHVGVGDGVLLGAATRQRGDVRVERQPLRIGRGLACRHRHGAGCLRRRRRVHPRLHRGCRAQLACVSAPNVFTDPDAADCG
jgi:hypothetical protein